MQIPWSRNCCRRCQPNATLLLVGTAGSPVNPADACWNGGPADAFQTEGLTLHKELDDERFPVIG
jgi:hypothetical protein